MMQKSCRQCETPKDLTDFYIDASKPDRRMSVCIPCVKATRKAAKEERALEYQEPPHDLIHFVTCPSCNAFLRVATAWDAVSCLCGQILRITPDPDTTWRTQLTSADVV